MSNIRIVFSGSGGQGVITAAIILAEAAVIYAGKNATQTQAYGAAARGGATRTDIIISEEQINYPGVIQPNILMTLTQTAYNSFSGIIRPGGLLLSDPRFVETTRKIDAKQLEIPMYEQVIAEVGKPIVYNICTLGALIGITQILEPEDVIKALEQRIPKDFMDMNMRAFDLGLVLGSKYQYRSFT